jgi:hypothetical protein
MAFTPTGYEPQTLDQIIQDLNQIFIDVFGANVNLNIASDNGQLIQQLAYIAQNNQNFMVLLTASLYNPDITSGLWLDALCALNGIVRNPATFSKVTCVCTGSVGVVIPVNTLIQNTNGDVFSNLTTVTIGSGGTVNAEFQAVQSGVVGVVANTVNNIINQVYGWDSVNNPSDGITGTVVQSDNSLRLNRTSLLSKYGSASIGSLESNLVQGLNLLTQYVFVAENSSSVDIVVGGVTLVPYSIYVSIVATEEQYQQIAEIIYNKKCPGINQNGAIEETYTDVESGTVFVAKFEVPAPTSLQVNITYPIGEYVANFETLVKTAIVNNFNGNDKTNAPEFSPVGIFENINVSRFVPSLLAIKQGGNYQELTIELKTGGTAAPSIILPADEIATLVANDVIVSFV